MASSSLAATGSGTTPSAAFTLTTTMPAMAKVAVLVRERGLAGSVKTIVGGAPVSAEFAREIGADGYGYDAANAVERVAALMAR